MNDRYLYRAKRTDNGEWAEGLLVTRKYPETGEVFEAHIIVDAYEQLGVMNFGNTPVLISPMDEDCCFRVDKNTICQCTGLKDKAGKLIWENDILMCHGNPKDLCKVCFGEFKVIDVENMVAIDIAQGWYYKPLETDALSKCEPFCYEMPLTNYYLERMDAEVIGNIFDNPELSEVGE